jgi:hypothetical protein
MRFFLGLILGIALTVGGAYVVDNMSSGPGARPMVNWDVVAKSMIGVCRARPRRLEEKLPADHGPTCRSRFASLGCLGNSLVFRVAERGDDLLFAQARPVVAIDRKRDAAALLQVTRPGQSAVSVSNSLNRSRFFLQGRHCAGAGWTTENSISHGQSSCASPPMFRE